MPIADRGYQPYEGPRLTTRRNHWVIMAMESRRIWASLLVKISVLLAILYGSLQVLWLLGYGYVVVNRVESLNQPEILERINRELVETFSPAAVLDDINGQIIFAILISLAWGAGAIATDIRSRALQFYFAKPVTESRYLLGKTLPLSLYCFVLCVFPGIGGAVVEGFVLRGQGLMASRFALVLPSIVYAALLALFISIVSVGISSLSRNRLLTLAYWASLLFVPLAVAFIVDLATSGSFQWLYLASPLSMLQTLGQAIFRVETEGPIQWYHALVVVTSICAGAVWLAWNRLSKAEVIG